MKPIRYLHIATLLYVLLIVFEARHVLSHHLWPGFGPNAGWVAAVLIPAWLYAAVSLIFMNQTSAFAMALGIFATLGRGALARIGDSPQTLSRPYFLYFLCFITLLGLAYAGRDEFTKHEKKIDETISPSPVGETQQAA